MKSVLILAACSALVFGCSSSTAEADGGLPGSDAAPPGADAASPPAADAGPTFDPVECRATVVQKDLASQNPEGADKPGVSPYWFGPGVDKATGKPTVPPGAIVTTTYLQLKPSGAAQQRFGELTGPIVGTLTQSPGLVAASLVTSASCVVARTIVVWKDEATMLAFVASEAHGKAIGAVGEVSRGGSITTSWLGADGEPSFATAAAKLEGHKGPVY